MSRKKKRKKKLPRRGAPPVAAPRKSVLDMIQELGTNGAEVLRYFEQVGGVATNDEIAQALELDISEVERCVALLKEWGAIQEAPRL